MIHACSLALATASAALALPPLQAETLVSGLQRPVEFIQHPAEPDVQLIAEQGGRVLVLEAGALRTDPLINIAPLIFVGHPEHGLVGMAIDPTSPNDLYLQYSRPPVGASRTERFTIDPATRTAPLTPRDEIIDRPQPSAIHSGNALRFAPSGELYISYGDGGPVGDPNGQGQNRESLFGSISRIIPGPAGGYTTPQDNPFVGVAGADEIWHYGLRNPWKFSLDLGPCSTGGMLIGDVGDTRVEELNFALPDEPGQNFGWSCFEGSLPFAGCEPPSGETFTFPVFEYDRASGLGRSISAGVVYRGRQMPHHRGRAFFGDFISGKILSVALEIDPTTGAPVATDLLDHTPDLVASLGTGLGLIVGFGEDASRELYAIDYNGRILRLFSSGDPADANADGAVDAADLALLISAWGDAFCSPADITNDERVDAADLAALLAAWGAD